MDDHLLEQVLVGAYVLLWSIPRLVASRTANPAKLRFHSPWQTVVMLIYSLGVCIIVVSGIVTIPAWASISQLRSVWAGALFLGVSFFLLLLCLEQLHLYYAFEIEIKDNHRVVTSGPYKFFRHPIYLSDILGYLGVCFIVSSWFTWLMLPAFVLALQMMARREESVLISFLGDEYERYKDSPKGISAVREWFCR